MVRLVKMTRLIKPLERKKDCSSASADANFVAYFWMKTQQNRHDPNIAIIANEIVICGDQTMPRRYASIMISAGPEITIKMTNADSRSATVAPVDLSNDKPNDFAMITRYKSPPSVEGKNWFNAILTVLIRMANPKAGAAFPSGMNLPTNQRHRIAAGITRTAREIIQTMKDRILVEETSFSVF